MDTLELLEVFGVAHFYDLATEDQVRELEALIAETNAFVAQVLQHEKIDSCEAEDFGV